MLYVHFVLCVLYAQLLAKFCTQYERFFHLIGKFNPFTFTRMTVMLIFISSVGIYYLFYFAFSTFPFYFASLIKYLFFISAHYYFRGSALLHHAINGLMVIPLSLPNIFKPVPPPLLLSFSHKNLQCLLY